MSWRSLPYVFIATGKVVPWCMSLAVPWRRVMGSIVAGSLGLTIAASLWIHPDYLAYFNWASGGPDRVPARLIDSNLDWGQDLVGLQRVVAGEHPRSADRPGVFRPDQPVDLRDAGRAVPLVPAAGAAGNDAARCTNDPSRLVGPARELAPGYYAVSATCSTGSLGGSMTRPLSRCRKRGQPAWQVFATARRSAISADSCRSGKIGHSIYVYRLSEEDIARAAPLFDASD